MPNMITRLYEAVTNTGAYTLADKKVPSASELGVTGTIIYNNEVVEEDYNIDLQHDLALGIYDRMRKSDGQVKAALLACELPLRSATWHVEPATDASADVDAAEFVSNVLFNEMSITFDDFLRHVLMMFPFGFSVFEKVWEIDGGRIKWRKFAPRLPKTILKFKTDSSGGLLAITQSAYMDNIYKEINIPIDKTLVFTLNREGSNYRGESLLRPAYKHWYYKDKLYKIDGMAAERHGLGIAEFKYPANSSDTTKSAIQKMGERIHAHQKGYVAHPDTHEFNLKGLSGQIYNTLSSIEHHNTMIVKSVLAQFLDLGTGDVGSWALSRDQSSFFLMSLQSVAKNICDTMNRYAIPQLVDYNFNVKEYPKLQAADMGVRDIGTWTKAVTDVMNAGALMKDEEIEKEIRRVLALPLKNENAMPEKQRSQRPDMPENPEEQPSEPPGFENSTVSMKQSRPTVTLRSSSKHYQNRPAYLQEKIDKAQKEPKQIFLRELRRTLDKAEHDIVKAVTNIQERQISNLVDQAMKLLKANKPEKLQDIDVRYKSEVTNAVANIYTALYKKGQKDVAVDLQEHVKRAAEPPLLIARAQALTSVLAARMKAALTWQALNQFGLGAVDDAALESVLTGLSKKEVSKVAKIGVSAAYNAGRNEEASNHNVGRVYRQALMDEGTCDSCADLHNKEWNYDDNEWRDYDPPDDNNCDGSDKCRCILVFVGKEA